MNVLSLFDGMSCGQIALNRIGIKPSNYYASELDKYAIQVTQANYPDTVQLGDVTKWREWGIDWSSIDLLMGGSPCQGFSFAGKGLAFDDPRSKLFFVYVDILNHVKSVNPNVKFLLENVKMKKEHMDVITSYLGVQPVFINSALVSAQNRQRWYWANWEFSEPEDKGIILADIIETDPDNTVFMSDKFCTRNASILRDDLSGKSKSLSAMEYVKNGRQGDYINTSVVCCAQRGRYLVDGVRQDHKMKVTGLTTQRMECRTDGKTNALTTVQKDNYITETTTMQYRKLTPIECERLQTVPDNYTNHVSNTQRYKMLGNGWTVDVIAHIFMAIERSESHQVERCTTDPS
jgi:DNA-cytosine methyltransferase